MNNVASRYTSSASGAILHETAEVYRAYPYRHDRLWFIRMGESIFAVMAKTSDDAWDQIWRVK